MQYVSTRDLAKKPVDFKTAALSGLAPDGGLYLPVAWPQFTDKQIARMATSPYPEVAFMTFKEFVGGTIPDPKLLEMCYNTYTREKFGSDEITPLVKLGNGIVVQELSNGPTKAFKDVALQLLGSIYEYFLGEDNYMNILGGTSGDTGSAAQAGCGRRRNMRIFMLHPHGRTTPLQRRQMTTNIDPSIFNIAVEGTFDDAQAIVKTISSDAEFRETYKVGAVNSITWPRILAQMVYYNYSASRLGTPGNPVHYSVPTGNFGDIFAGFGAKSAGLHIGQLGMACNANDILYRLHKTGSMQQAAHVIPTLSPSMDIQLSSNFERYLYLLYDRNPKAVRQAMKSFTQTKEYTIGKKAMHRLRKDFSASRMPDAETVQQMRLVYQIHDYLMDPHTAAGYGGALKMREQGDLGDNLVVMQTADPVKFEDAVKKATGITPPLPEDMKDIMTREERYTVLPADVAVVKAFVIKHALTGPQ